MIKRMILMLVAVGLVRAAFRGAAQPPPPPPDEQHDDDEQPDEASQQPAGHARAPPHFGHGRRRRCGRCGRRRRGVHRSAEECGQPRAGIAGTHEGLADEEGIDLVGALAGSA